MRQVIVVGVAGGRDRRADGRSRGRVLGDAAGYAVAGGDGAAGVRPVAGAFVVGGANLHFVALVRGEAAQRRFGARAAEAGVRPGGIAVLAVLHVVVGDGGFARHRRGIPIRVQLGLGFGVVLVHVGRGGRGGRLGNVGYGDGHRDGVVNGCVRGAVGLLLVGDVDRHAVSVRAGRIAAVRILVAADGLSRGNGYLPRGLADGEGAGVGSGQRVIQRVAVRVGIGGYHRAHVGCSR